MPSDKDIKADFKKTLKDNYAKFFPVGKLEELGFSRRNCQSCGQHFWSREERKTCGDSSCEGRFSFIGKKREDVDFIEVWKRFEKMFSRMGYTSIKRYPSVARWNPTMDFTIASIADFQPYVVSGEVEPPAKKVIVPQTCVRFNDIDNVGITGGHYTGFTMIGQHAFLPKADFNQADLFHDYYRWYTEGMRLKPEEFVIHEDAWAGGGNYGPCLEFFSGGLEIGNQVYMMFESTPAGGKELPQKVLDMGMGQERVAWFLSGTGTSYTVNFPTVKRHLFKTCGIKEDADLIGRFVPYAGMLNIDEAENIDAIWKKIAKAIDVDMAQLKGTVLAEGALYAIGDHARTLLYTIGDGALPGNVGGGYNLRVLYRRMQSFIERYGWDIDIGKVISLHAKYLKPQYPEFAEKEELVKKILAVEKRKYLQNRERNAVLISSLLGRKTVQEIEKKLPELYDSQGILPEEIAKEAERQGKKIAIPENFYAHVTALHDATEEKAKKGTMTKRGELFDLQDIPDTTILFHDRWDLVDFPAFVLKIIGGKMVALDETAFYPTSGGQVHDIGTIAGIPVVDVFKQGAVILHVLEKSAHVKKGDRVQCHIDLDRRTQLAQHHTAAHILNGAAKRVLGEHVWQAGASKTPEKARLDITHYDNLTDEEIRRIEDLANRVIRENRPILKSTMDRNVAEREYGMAIYQGGAVPGRRLRIVNIADFDVEACGGTHLDVTGDVYLIKIARTSKIQDGVVRIEFVAGSAARNAGKEESGLISDLAKLLSCAPEEIPGRANELFMKWKQAGKAAKKKQEVPPDCFMLSSREPFAGDIVDETAKRLNTQKEHIKKTIRRFQSELEKMKHG